MSRAQLNGLITPFLPRLENRSGCKPRGGSNPSPSALTRRIGKPFARPCDSRSVSARCRRLLATNHVGVNVEAADLRLGQAHLLGDGKNLLLREALELLLRFPHVRDADTGVGLRRPVEQSARMLPPDVSPIGG